MVQTQTVDCSAPPARSQKIWRPKQQPKIKNKFVSTKPESLPKKTISEHPLFTLCPKTSPEDKKQQYDTKPNTAEMQEPKEEKKVIPLAKGLKAKVLEERLAKERQAEEEREKFVKEAAERKATEREEIIKQAKRLVLYRKPMCRRINQGLLVSECLRELDAQIKFRETLKNVDKDEELVSVNLMKADMAKYQDEMKQKTEKQVEARKKYTTDLKKQIEENRIAAETKATIELEAEKEDQIMMTKRLEEIKQYEAQQLINKKEKLKKFFKDAIEEKKQFDLTLKREEEFENRANEIYQNAKVKIQKMQKTLLQKEKEERLGKSRLITEKYLTFAKSVSDLEDGIYKKTIEEQEEQFQEEQRTKQERKDRMKKEMQDYREKVIAERTKQVQEESDLKTWEKMQMFKKIEFDKEWEAEERRRMWDEKMKYASSLKKCIAEREARDSLAKLEKAQDAELEEKLVEKENKKILDYAEEVINESGGVRPLYPIFKAVEDCKREMGLIPPKKMHVVDTPPPQRRRKPLATFKCSKFVPEDKILYL